MADPSNLEFEIHVPKEENFNWLGITVSNGKATRLTVNGFTALISQYESMEAKYMFSGIGKGWSNGRTFELNPANTLQDGLTDGKWHKIAFELMVLYIPDQMEYVKIP